MTKTVCDICGKDMPTARIESNSKDLQFCISSYGRNWDICNKCREGLNRWMANAGKKERTE